VIQVLLREGMNTTPEVIGLPTTLLSPALFAQLDPAGSNMPLVVVGVPEFIPHRYEAGTAVSPTRAIVLGLQNPGDLGAAVRTAVHFGWTDIILTKESAHPFHPEALLRAGAAALRARFYTGESVLELPSVIEGGFRLAGMGKVPSQGPVHLFIGTQDKPAWPHLGNNISDLELDPGTLLAAAIGKVPAAGNDQRTT
jgi:hypothetical protein